MDILLTDINIKGGTQPRAAMEWSVVAEYAEEYKKGTNMPPLIVFKEGKTFWLADGFHRYNAAQEAHLESINAEVKEGSKQDAIRYAIGANVAHGHRRTNADKRRAVEMALQHPEFKIMSDSVISKHCDVSDHLVAEVRSALEATSNSRGSTQTRVGKDGKQRSATSSATSQKRKKKVAAGAKGGTNRKGKPDTTEAKAKKSAAAKKAWAKRKAKQNPSPTTPQKSETSGAMGSEAKEALKTSLELCAQLLALRSKLGKEDQETVRASFASY